MNKKSRIVFSEEWKAMWNRAMATEAEIEERSYSGSSNSWQFEMDKVYPGWDRKVQRRSTKAAADLNGWAA
jgi:hypothetical protein